MGSLVNHENAHRRAGELPGLHQGTPQSPALAPALVAAPPPTVRPQWGVHKCCKCDAVFKYQGSLVRHQLIHHRNRGRPALPRVKVPKRKSSTALVPAAAAERENNTGEVHRCGACHAEFDNSISLSRHKAAHTRHGTWPVKKRPQTPKASSAAYALPTMAGPSSSNSKSSTAGQRPSTSRSGGGRCDCDMLSCEDCMARLLEDADNFNGGDIEFAPLPLPYPCHICPAEFRSSEELSDHIREHMESFP